jgi:hypothetical protein
LLCVSAKEPIQCLRLQFTPPAQCALTRSGETCAARLRLHGRNGKPGILRGATGPLPPALPQLHREIPNDEAARAFIRFFAILHRIHPGQFGAPTQEHRRILQALAATGRESCKLSLKKQLRFLEDPPAATPSGLEATWPEQKLLILAGACAEAPFPGEAPAWRLLGEGAITLNFSEDCKGLTVYVYDHYGRPRAAWGGKRGCSHRFSLRPGEQIALEQG